MPRRVDTAGEKAVYWIEQYCRDHGRPVRLSPDERATLYRIYDAALQEPIEGRLGAFLCLYHLAGYGAVDKSRPRPVYKADIFTVLASCGDELRRVLRRRGSEILCPELGTVW